VVPLSIHHPLFVAENFVLLDHLTRGRVMLGLGSGGGLPSDPHLLGLNPEEQQPRFLEAFEVVMRLLTGLEPLSVKTGWFELREAVLQLRPYTRPHMPVAVVTDTNPQSLALVGRHGTRWLTSLTPDRFGDSWWLVEEAALEVGQTADRSKVSMAVNLHLAESRERAVEEIRVGAARERFDFSSAVTGSPLPSVDRDDWAGHLASRPTDIVGTPEDAIEKIEAIQRETGGIGGLIIRSKEWASREATWRSFELFARHVMPRFRGSLAGLEAAEAVAGRVAGRSR
jgi:limonene 1,2-monooxygenase